VNVDRQNLRIGNVANHLHGRPIDIAHNDGRKGNVNDLALSCRTHDKGWFLTFIVPHKNNHIRQVQGTMYIILVGQRSATQKSRVLKK
jgi:hypothetical protein